MVPLKKQALKQLRWWKNNKALLQGKNEKQIGCSGEGLNYNSDSHSAPPKEWQPQYL